MLGAIAGLMLAAAPWTKADTAFEVTGAALHIADWGQTVWIARHPRLQSETNPVLGKHPTTARVHAYFAVTLVGHALIARALPRPYRTAWQAVWIGVEAMHVETNRAMGIRIAF